FNFHFKLNIFLGNMKDELYCVIRKNYESLLIFCDIVKTDITFTRQNIIYILVYNDEASKKYTQSIISKRKRDSENLNNNEIQESTGYDEFLNFSNENSNYSVDIFNLKNRFEKMYFKEVHTYTKEQFERDFASKLQ
ncbi:MAG: hypothetical protein RSE93_09110, partial [Oscillospiraceae bacterium]